MASNVQWIKITTDVFDDEKILLIDSMPEADKILIIWFKLLCLAGKQNNKGVFMFNGVPYTTKMLSTILRRDEDTIQNAIDIFEAYGMIHYEGNAIVITNWGKHQSLDKIEANNAYMREYMQKYRKKQKDVAMGKVNDKVNGKVNINSTDIETNKDKEKIKKEKTVSPCEDSTSEINYDQVISSFNDICQSLPNVVKLTDNRKKAIETAERQLGDMTFEKFFQKVENSDFLTGRKTDWRANFDWIISQGNIVKILEGNFDNRKKSEKENYTNISKYKNLTMEV